MKSSFLINWLHLNDVAFCRIKLILKVVIISLCYNLEVPPILYHIHYITLYEGCRLWYLYYRHETMYQILGLMDLYSPLAFCIIYVFQNLKLSRVNWREKWTRNLKVLMHRMYLCYYICTECISSSVKWMMHKLRYPLGFLCYTSEWCSTWLFGWHVMDSGMYHKLHFHSILH